jgi:rubrerythrin
MMRLFITLALIFVILLAVRTLRKSVFPREERPPRVPRGPSSTARGAPRALVCGECGTQFEPQEGGWICPKCGK